MVASLSLTPHHVEPLAAMLIEALLPLVVLLRAVGVHSSEWTVEWEEREREWEREGGRERERVREREGYYITQHRGEQCA